MDYKKYIAEKLKIDGVSQDEIYELVALPPNTEMGDYALPCFKFAKLMRKSPVMIAEELKNIIMSDIIPFFNSSAIITGLLRITLANLKQGNA